MVVGPAQAVIVGNAAMRSQHAAALRLWISLFFRAFRAFRFVAFAHFRALV
jgi:hypothetical protein